MVLGKRHTIKLLDDAECFTLWYQLGSVERVSKHLEKEGFVNSRTQKPFTPMAIWHSGMRYALENLDEAYQKYKDVGAADSREEWERYMVEKAMTVYYSSVKRFMAWIRKNKFEKYKDVYEMRFASNG